MLHNKKKSLVLVNKLDMALQCKEYYMLKFIWKSNRRNLIKIHLQRYFYRIYNVYRYIIEPEKLSIGSFPLLVRVERLLLFKSINIAIITITKTSTIGIMIGANDLEKKEQKQLTWSVILKKVKLSSKDI